MCTRPSEKWKEIPSDLLVYGQDPTRYLSHLSPLQAAIAQRRLYPRPYRGRALARHRWRFERPLYDRATTALMTAFLFVPGAWHGGWCWKKVIPCLRAAGHEVYTPSLAGLGDRSHLLTPEVDLDTHVQDILSVLL